MVVDMRGPNIILQVSHEANKKNKHKFQPSIHIRAHGGDGPSSPSSATDIAKSLKWTITQLDKSKSFLMSHHHANLFLFPSKITS